MLRCVSAHVSRIAMSASLPAPIINISAYRFVTIDDCEALRERLQAECERLQLKGTILIAEEGINVFLAGPREAIDAVLAWLHADLRFADLTAKESLSDAPPFRHLKVKHKREIITMNRPAIQPQSGRAPAVSAETLRRWLDQGHDDAGRPVVTLDTRNAFEADLGRFEDCIDYRIDKFSEFPPAVEANAAALRDKTVVTYCTGGIRCEKAAIVMREAGIENVYQLDGGILKYFEEVGDTHWQGSCFVFDERRALDAALTPATPPKEKVES
ncbi:MAG: sulfurtransferase [Rhodocyclales bacterium]|nr:sulfurtransferase [Rhodocyclales bacterium]